jgi:hypothetical protein
MRRREDNKTNIKDIGWEYEDCIQLAPDMGNCWAPANTGGEFD